MVEFAETRHDRDAAVNYRQGTQPAAVSTISTFDSLARCYPRRCQNITALKDAHHGSYTDVHEHNALVQGNVLIISH
jgi:hypothetical protein